MKRLIWNSIIAVLTIGLAAVGFEPGARIGAGAAQADCVGPDTALFCTICPGDTLLRPGRYADLIHGAVNHTDHWIYVYYVIVGERWPQGDLVSDYDPIFPGATELFLVRIEVPDSAAPGVNKITWWAGRQSCSYNVIIPELLSSVSAEPAVDCVHLSWMVADSSADTVAIYRREPFGAWNAIGNAFASVGFPLTFEDRDVVPGSSYEYRLGLPVANRQIYRGNVSIAVPDLLSEASVKATEGRVHLTWTPADPTAYSAVVYRKRDKRDWIRQASIGTDDGAALSYEDRSIEPGVGYRYRLGIVVNGREFFRGEMAVVAAVGDADFRLDAGSANPTSGSLPVAVTMGSGEPARLDVFDLEGRLRCTRNLRLEHARIVYDAAGGQKFLPGVYLVRLRQGTRSQTLRLTVVR